MTALLFRLFPKYIVPVIRPTAKWLQLWREKFAMREFITQLEASKKIVAGIAKKIGKKILFCRFSAIPASYW